tara:strand:+ start:376 stop:570 length:195 start_codon:yes stop_codon:yes gene_type:complete
MPGAQAEVQIPNPLGGLLPKIKPPQLFLGDRCALAAFNPRPQAESQIGAKLNNNRLFAVTRDQI